MIEPTLYSIEPIPGRGMGMVANTNIAKGAKLISEAPLLIVPKQVADGLVRLHIFRRLKQLDVAQQRMYLELYNAFDGDPIMNIAMTNGIALGPNDDAGIFPLAARINHSCRPNAQVTFNKYLGHLMVHTLREIDKGQEITISYLYTTEESAKRQELLQRQFRFACACEVCCLPADELKDHDRRISQIKALSEEVSASSRDMSTHSVCFAKVRRIVTLLRENNMEGDVVGKAYYNAYQIVVANGDLARASVFARRAAGRSVEGGGDNPFVENMSALAVNPARHRHYGATFDWETELSDVPWYLSDGDFEAWLWRQGLS